MKKNTISISHPTQKVYTEIDLEASKSESNRALIIQALGGAHIKLQNLSNARDTQTMIRLLKSESKTLDVLDAGTAMRFLTAYRTVTNRPAIMTGTERMQQRPIKILVEALRELGAEIEYLKNEGYPPIHIKSFKQQKREISIAGNVSSQYISALLMVAPYLPQGLKLNLMGKVNSKPYISMTLKLMEKFGVTAQQVENLIEIGPQAYQAGSYSIESDWSGASYWYSIAALAKSSKIRLNGLRKDSFQGDSVMAKIGKKLGIETEFVNGAIILTPIKCAAHFEHHFADCPDLAQTVSVICAAKGQSASLTGLESLRIKETDRIAAIKSELQKAGVPVMVEGDEKISMDKKAVLPAEKAVFHTYEDHRMAMALAPLALINEIAIEDPEVVNKSYPSFWEDLKRAGFEVTVY